MPIPLGVLAVAGAGAGPAPAPITDAYVHLTTEILSSTQTSVTFSNLSTYSSTYKHLQVRAVIRGSSAFNLTGRFNGTTTDQYNWHWIEANGSNVAAGGSVDSAFMNLGVGVSETNIFSGFVIDFLDVFNTSKNKTAKSFYGAATAGTKWMGMASATWRSTTAASSLALTGSTFQVGSRFSLYGLKA